MTVPAASLWRPSCAIWPSPEASTSRLLAGAGGVDRRITNPHPQKTGLALSGFDKYLREGRVLVLGESEVSFLESLPAEERIAVVRRVFSHQLPCLVITAGCHPPADVVIEADRANLPLLLTRAATPLAMARLSAALDAYLAARTVVHGVLMDILGLGVLIVGESGIGKRRMRAGPRRPRPPARGRRCGGAARAAESYLLGTCPELTRHHMEIRGLGLINVQDLFGVASTRHRGAGRARRGSSSAGTVARSESRTGLFGRFTRKTEMWKPVDRVPLLSRC